jgi:hypothetical protein
MIYTTISKKKEKSIIVQIKDKEKCEEFFHELKKLKQFDFSFEDVIDAQVILIKEASKVLTFRTENFDFEIDIVPNDATKDFAAMFNSIMSNDTTLYFEMVMSTVIFEYEKYVDEDRKVLFGYSMYRDNIWLHEFAHGEDVVYLKINNANRSKLAEDSKLYSAYCYLSKLRHEGIAVFYEELYGNDREVPSYGADKNAIKEVTKAVNITADRNLASAFYEESKFLILNTLYYKYPILRPLIDKLAGMGEEVQYKLAYFKDFDIIHSLFSLQVEELIFVPLQNKVSLPYKTKFDDDLLLNLNKFSLESGYESLEILDYKIKKLVKLSKRIGLDKLFFISDLVTDKMTNNQITEAFKLWSAKISEPSDSIYHSLVNEVYEYWKKEEDVLSSLKLSYLFQKNDIISDEIPNLGWVDDMLILDA